MNDAEILTLLSQAENHFQNYRWDEALACFEQVLQNTKQHPAASDGLRKTRNKKQIEASIVEAMAEARVALQAGRTSDALAALVRAQTLGANEAILNHHAEIVGLRDRIEEHMKWQKSVDDALKKAKAQQHDKAPHLALETLETLLRDLTSSGQDDLGESARQERDHLQSALELDERIEAAAKAYEAQDYEQAARLSASLRNDYPDDKQIKKDYESRRWLWQNFQERLEQAREALAEKRLDDAAALLSKLRDDAPNNPDWRALWLKAFTEHGLHQLANGRQAFQRSDFVAAQQAFRQADAEAFTRVLEVFADHSASARGAAEARALTQVVEHTHEALSQARQLRWDAARAALRSARQKRHEATEVRNDSFGDIEAVLQALHGELEEQAKRWDEAHLALQEGQISLKALDLGRAGELFRRGLQAMGTLNDDSLRSKLTDALQKAEQRRLDVERLLEMARSETANGALERLRSAYKRWPTAPGMPDLLAQQLIDVARQALNTQQKSAAAAWCNEAAGLPGVSSDLLESAQQIVGAIGCQDAVTGILNEVDRLLAQEQRQLRPTLAGHRQIVDLLQQGHSTAQACPELLPPLDERLKPALERLKRLEKAEPLLEKAEAQRQAGEWPQAARVQEQAVKMLGDLAAEEERARSERWQEIAGALGEMQKQANDALQAARAQFKQLAGGDVGAVDWNTLRQELSRVESALVSPPEGAEPLPLRWQELREAGQALAARADIVQRAYGSVLAGAPNLSELTALAAQDARDTGVTGALRSLREQSKDLLKVQAEQFLATAREHAERGEWSEATERLADATGVGADAVEVQAEIKHLERRSAVWQKVKRLTEEGVLKSLSNSPREALDALRTALRTALDPDSHLPDTTRQQLSTLLSLEGRLEADEAYEQAQGLRNNLITVEAGYNRLVQTYLSGPVENWLDLASRNARIKAVDSAMGLGQYADGYKNAIQALRQNPDDEIALKRAAEAREKIKERLVVSVRKRLDWARELQAKGAFEEAIEVLNQIVTEFIEPVRTPFPEITSGDPDLDDLEKARLDLGIELKRFAERSFKLQPLLEAARAAFVNEQWASVQQSLDEAKRLDEGRAIKQIWNDLDGLENSLQRHRERALRNEVREQLTATRLLLMGAPNDQEVENAIKKLEMARDGVTVLGDAGLSEEYGSQLAALAAWLEDDRKLKKELNTAEERKAAGAKREQLQALERARVLATGRQRAALDAELAELRPQVAHENELQAAWDAGRDAFAVANWSEAQAQLARARRLGLTDPSLPGYDKATRAGLLLKDIESLIKTDSESAQLRLQQAQRMVQGCVPAEEIGLPEKIQNYLEIVDLNLKRRESDIRRQREQHSALESLLREAQADLRGQKFEDARKKLAQILEDAPQHSEALPLVQVVEAEEIRQRGDYRAALTRVTGVLEQYPNSLAAKALQTQLQAEVEPGEALARARSMADRKQFADAQAELTRARDLNPHHPRLAETQTYVQEQEDRFRDRALGPANAALRRQDYRLALSEYKILLTQAGAPDFKAEIEALCQNALNEWAERQQAAVQTELMRSDLQADDLVKQRNNLQEILTTVPGPSAQGKQMLEELVRRIEIRRLRLRLDAGKDALEKKQIEDAQTVADELEKEVKEIGDFKLTRDVGEFSSSITRHQVAFFKTRRNDILSEVREKLDQATELQQLAEAYRRADDVLKLPGFAQDTEASSLKKEAHDEQERYAETNRVVTVVLQRLRTGWYRGARQSLDEMQDISRLLAGRVNELRELTRQLQSAADLESGDPQTALEVYHTLLETAAKPPYRLGDNVQAAINRCKTQLGEQTLEQARQYLEGTIPDHNKAQAELETALAQGWLNEADGPVAALRKRIAALMLTAEAIYALVEENAPERALTLFEETRQQAAGGELDPLSAGWEVVGRAWLALNRDELDQARSALAQTPQLLEAEPLVTQLKDRLAVKEQAMQAIKAAQRQTDAALLQTPPDYQEAIKAARTALDASTPPSPAAHAVADRVLKRLQTEAEELRRQDRYQDALSFVGYIKQLDLAKAVALGNEFEQERARLLDETVAQAELALSQDNLTQAEQHTVRVRRLADARADGRAAFLAQRIEQRSAELRSVDEALRAARQAMQPSVADWASAVNEARLAEGLAPRYEGVHQLIKELRSRLSDEVERNRSTGNYPVALVCTDLALQLGRDDALTLSRGQILTEQSDRVQAEYQEAQQALAVFDLERAERAQAAGFRANNQEVRFSSLTERMRRAKELMPRLKQVLESCWAHLQQRDFEQASATLQALGDMGDFAEVRAWQKYLSGLMDGIRLVSVEKRSMAVHYFSEAEKSLRLNSQETLSPLWGERLREERRQAVYYAWRLREEVSDMERTMEQARALRDKGKLVDALPMMTDVVTRNKQFPDFVKGRFAPPADFDAGIGGFGQNIVGATFASQATPSPMTAVSSAPVESKAGVTGLVDSPLSNQAQSKGDEQMAESGPDDDEASIVFSFDPVAPVPEEPTASLALDQQQSVPEPTSLVSEGLSPEPIALDDWDSWWNESTPAADETAGV